MRRQIKKFLDQNKDKEEVDQDLVKVIANVEATKKQKAVFQNMDFSDDSASDAESPQGQQKPKEATASTEATMPQSSKPKTAQEQAKLNKQKKKKQKKLQQQQQQQTKNQQQEPLSQQAAKDQDIEFLEQLIQQQPAEEAQEKQGMEQMIQKPDGILVVNTRRLNYKKELANKFKTEGELTKKDKNQKGNRKQYLTYNPDLQPDKVKYKFTLENTQLNDYGLQQFKLVPTQGYLKLQQEYAEVKAMHSPQGIINFIQWNPYHGEALLNISEYFRIKGDQSSTLEFLERSLYLFETSMGYQFVKFLENPVVELEIETDEYSRVFLMTLFKYRDILERKGCEKTALEFAKIIIKLSSSTDTTGTLLLHDHHCLLADQYEYLLAFTSKFGKEIYKSKRYSLVFMPNYIYSCSVAKFLLSEQGRDDFTFTQEHLEQAKCNFGESPLDAPHQVLIIQALLLYPNIVARLAEKNEYNKVQLPGLDTYSGFQRKPFSELLKEEFLSTEIYVYWFLQMENDEDKEGLQKVIRIFIEKCQRHFWKQQEVVQWVRGALGFVLNQIKENRLDLNEFYIDLTKPKEGQEIFNELPFQFRRYKDLEFFNFQEKIDTVDANILNQMQMQQDLQQQMPENFNPLNQNHGLVGALLATLLPWVHNPNAQA